MPDIRRGLPEIEDRARHGKLRRSSSLANLVKVLITAVLVVAISGTVVAAYAVWSVVGEAKTFDLGAQPGANALDVGAEQLNGELTILLVGSDKRKADSIMNDGEEGDRNDVNLLLHIPASHDSATIVSFPRDLMVPIPSCTDPDTGDVSDAMSSQQINTAVKYGGPACVAATITEITGMPIPYVAEVDFDGVIGISNALGGVTVCLAQPIEDSFTGLNLPAGEVTVTGVDALNFVRTRHGVGDGSDVSRISNQQVFMSALLRQLRSAETLSNPAKVYNLAKTGFQYMSLSSSMASLPFLQALAGTAANIDLSKINFVQYPTFADPDDPNRLVPDQSSADVLFDVIKSGKPFQVSKVGGAAVSSGTAPAATPEPSSEPDAGDSSATDGTAGAGDQAVTVLPDNITGQSAASETCSAGRTEY